MVSRLAELCEIQIAIVLANKSEFKKEILRLPELDIDHIFWHSGTEPWFENMDEKVLDILKKLPFEFREKILSSLVIFCLSQSIEWAKFHNKIFDLPLDYSFSFLRSSFFTSKGTIDNEKAAREILKDSEISSSIRFCIACYYCFSDIIHSLWEQLPENTRHEIDNGRNVLGIGGNNRIVEIWSQFLLGKYEDECDSFSLYKIKKLLDNNFSLYKIKKLLRNYVHDPCDDDDDDDDYYHHDNLDPDAHDEDDYYHHDNLDPDAHFHYDDESCKNGKDVQFKNCFEELNELEIKEAVIFSRKEIKHFLENLESFDDRLRERDTILSLFPLQLNLPFQQYIEIVLFLFRHLDDEQLKIFFKPEMLYFVWFHLLSWPYHNMFMVTMNKFLDILPTKGFCLILIRIVDLMRNNVSGKLCDYHNILRSFWMQSPSTFKRFFFRYEGNRNIFNEIYYEKEENNIKSGLECEFADLCKFEWSVICDLFRLPFTSEDEKIIRMIFESATLEEKSAFVRLKGITVSEIAFETSDLRKIDLFIELCIENERVTSFKKGLFHDEEIKDILFNFVREHKLIKVQNILNWAFCAEEIKEWQQSLFLQHLKENRFLRFTFDDLKRIGEFLEWKLSSDEIKSFKESLVSDVEEIADLYKSYMLTGDFQDINNLLNGIFSSENEIVKYKKRLAFQLMGHMDYSLISSDFSLLTKLVKWCSLTEEECKDFKRHFAFRGETVESYSKFVAQGQFYQTDEFIQWAELNESEMKAFKKLLVFNEQENVISSYVSFTLNSKPDFIKELINWTQFSEEEVKEFYSLLPEKFNLYINITANKTKLSDIKDFFSGFPLSESEIKRHKKDILLKSIDIIEYFILEDKWDEAEELLNWCFSSKTEFCKFKKNIPLNVSNLCLNLILHQRFGDVDKFCSWTGICDSSKKTLLSKIIFDSRIYEIVSGWFVLLNNNRIEGLLNFLSSHKILSTNWEESFLNWYYEKKKQRECYNSKCCRIFNWHDYYECRKHLDYEFLCGLCRKFIADSERFSELIEKEINKSENRQKRKLESSFDDYTNEAKRSLLS